MVDLSTLKSKLKALAVDAHGKLESALGDGRTSTHRYINIVGETFSLDNTTTKSIEKVAFNKADFERLYVPASLQSEQADLEEILIRMFPLVGKQTGNQVLPPESDKEFALVRESLTYRLEVLRNDILSDTSNTVSVRAKLSHFNALSKLIQSLEQSFVKKRRFTYRAIVIPSESVPSKEPKIPLTNEEAEVLLRKFGLLLLQRQYQLPGFSFKVSPNQIVADVQRASIPNEEDFVEAVEKQGEIQSSIQDVLDPNTKEKRLLDLLEKKVLSVIDAGSKQLYGPTLDQFVLRFGEVPFEEALETFLSSLFNILFDFEMESANSEQTLKNKETEIEELTDTLDDLNDKIRVCNETLSKVKADMNVEEGKEENTRSDLQKIRAAQERLENERRALRSQISSLQEELRQKQTLTQQREEAFNKLRLAQSELEGLRGDLKTKEKTIASLSAKEAEMKALQLQIQELEEKEALDKEEKSTLAEKLKTFEKLSSEKVALEEKLAEYDENLEELTRLVSSVPIPPSSKAKTPFEELRDRIRSILPVAEEESTKADSLPLLNLSLPMNTIPSMLEIQANTKAYFCDFLNVLSRLVSKYFDTPEGQEVQEQLTSFLDTLYEETYIPSVVAKTLQKILLYANNTLGKDLSEMTRMLLKDFSTNTLLRDVSGKAETVFFQGKENGSEQIQPHNKLLSEYDLPSYPVLFLLYLLALRDWVNCVEISSKPLECPQIPPRLKRTVPCK